MFSPSEHSIATAKASVMLYNNETKKWEASGGSQGMSKIQVYHHPVNNTYRIVGRKLADHSVSFLVVYTELNAFMTAKVQGVVLDPSLDGGANH